MNNLYGTNMSESHPCKHLRWDTSTTLKNILNTSDNSVKGYIVEVDFKSTQHMHDTIKIIFSLVQNH